jgi:hypothetical protein
MSHRLQIVIPPVMSPKLEEATGIPVDDLLACSAAFDFTESCHTHRTYEILAITYKAFRQMEADPTAWAQFMSAAKANGMATRRRFDLPRARLRFAIQFVCRHTQSANRASKFARVLDYFNMFDFTPEQARDQLFKLGLDALYCDCTARLPFQGLTEMEKERAAKHFQREISAKSTSSSDGVVQPEGRPSSSKGRRTKLAVPSELVPTKNGRVLLFVEMTEAELNAILHSDAKMKRIRVQISEKKGSTWKDVRLVA